MTRLLAFLLFAVLVLAVTDSATRVSSHDVVHRVTAGSVPVVEHPSPAVSALPQQTVRSDRHRTPHRCNNRHWRRSLTADERWVDWRESRLNPRAVEPSTRAFGLGQLLPSTYRNLGLPMSAAPCQEIKAQRRYAKARYGNFRRARAWWEANGWW